jgi:two-component system alkaline phosphatase synthesis response regulator PhoP/two-component system response regulator VicR
MADSKRHVLVVDDENNIRRLIEVNLVRAGYRVSTAMDGVDALEKIAADRPDIVVLDVMMPRMDGFEVLHRLKAEPSTAEIHVLMLTAKAQDADVFHGWKSGADGYLTKPFNPMELLIWVRRTLDQHLPVGTGPATIRI